MKLLKDKRLKELSFGNDMFLLLLFFICLFVFVPDMAQKVQRAVWSWVARYILNNLE